MKCICNGKEYEFREKVLEDEKVKNAYFALSKEVFWLEFQKWYESGYWDEHFIPYVLLDGDKVVSSIAVCINDVKWKNGIKRYVQLSTVMTAPEYRGRGLSQWLMEWVLKEWTPKSDAIYLYANDKVVDFYPRFGFEKFFEYQCEKPVGKGKGTCRKLDIQNPNDWDLILEKYKKSNPFAEFAVDNLSVFTFHTLLFLKDDIYYIEEFDAVVIGKFDEESFLCYDIFTGSSVSLEEILGAVVKENTKTVTFGFTPKQELSYIPQISQEEDCHLFVLKGKENMFKDNKIMFPLLARA